jgi:hypothetical protein
VRVRMRVCVRVDMSPRCMEEASLARVCVCVCVYVCVVCVCVCVCACRYEPAVHAPPLHAPDQHTPRPLETSL